MKSVRKFNPTDIPRFVYGTTRLGDSTVPIQDRISIAREAIVQGAWIHTSNQYGDALNVLKSAFDLDRSHVPPTIVKIGWSSVEEVRAQIVSQSAVMDISSITVGQLCAGGQVADDLATGGPSVAGLIGLKEEGIVGGFVLEVFPWTSQVAIDAIRGEHADELIDGYIFYLNPLQRFATNELWDLLLERDKKIIAMRTVCGGNVHRVLESKTSPEWLRQRAAAVAPLFDRSGIQTWTEFAVRYSLGFAPVLATVGSTSRPANLAEFFSTTKDTQPLPNEIVEELLLLQRKWSDDVDKKAEPWTM